MGTIGIIANPNSGKDVRRLISHAIVVDNAEKVSIMQRIIVGVTELGGHKIYLMPNGNHLSERAIANLEHEGYSADVQILDMPLWDRPDDTTLFTQKMVEEMNADVIIVMGGDGTCRAAAKTIGDVPMIPVSTGTNNVYPTLMEGTAVAVAAAAIADGVLTREQSGTHGKRIEIQVNDDVHDIALIDAAISKVDFVGVRAILNASEISSVLVTQCHPASIGISALPGSLEIVSPQEEYGFFLQPDWNEAEYIAAFSAGVFTRFGVAKQQRLPVGESITLHPDYHGTIAVDGEREVSFHEGDELKLSITRNGPRKVDVRRAAEIAAELGYYRCK